MTASRIRAWARYGRYDTWWWGTPLLGAAGVRECRRNEALPRGGPVENT
ncbi:hypothetical protein [Hymenobacter coccineus]|nr:hypothetical protein [Hymenobacter coccineus]